MNNIDKEDAIETSVVNEKVIIEPKKEKASLGWFLIGFLINPLIGLGLHFVFRRKHPAVGERLMSGAIAGFVLIGAIYTIIFMSLIVLAILGIQLGGFKFPDFIRNSVEDAIRFLIN